MPAAITNYDPPWRFLAAQVIAGSILVALDQISKPLKTYKNPKIFRRAQLLVAARFIAKVFSSTARNSL
ncbi:MAG TPA: hypothetical protein VH370_17385 [Humisphaera sp.]|nr:hypothetical protein [Humisphaera sp.]